MISDFVRVLLIKISLGRCLNLSKHLPWDTGMEVKNPLLEVVLRDPN